MTCGRVGGGVVVWCLLMSLVTVNRSVGRFLFAPAETWNACRLWVRRLGVIRLVSLVVLGTLIPPRVITCGWLLRLLRVVSLFLTMLRLSIGLWLGLQAV